MHTFMNEYIFVHVSTHVCLYLCPNVCFCVCVSVHVPEFTRVAKLPAIYLETAGGMACLHSVYCKSFGVHTEGGNWQGRGRVKVEESLQGVRRANRTQHSCCPSRQKHCIIKTSDF